MMVRDQRSGGGKSSGRSREDRWGWKFFVLLVVTMGATRDTSNHSLFKCFVLYLTAFNVVFICILGTFLLPWGLFLVCA